MPTIKSQDEKTPLTIAAQPKDVGTSKVQLIMAYDLCGWQGNRIAAEVGMTPPRVSIIRNTPLYQQQLAKRKEELHQQVLAEKSGKIVAGDPVEQLLKERALDALQKKLGLMENAQSEFVQSSAASDILDRAGYGPKQKTTRRVIEVTDKMADRFERVLARAPQTRVTITEEESQ